jgi:hypothetical protein
MVGPFKLRSRRTRWLLVGLPALCALVLASSGAEAAGCKKVSGKFTHSIGGARSGDRRRGDVGGQLGGHAIEAGLLGRGLSGLRVSAGAVVRNVPGTQAGHTGM